MTTTVKRKDYTKPTMKVVELQHRTMLLQASQTSQTNGAEMNVVYEEEDF